MAETLSTLSIVSFIAAAIFLALAAFLWFFLAIPTVIGDLNGRNARKSIARMRASNEKSGARAYKENRTNLEREKLSGTMRGSGKLKKSRGKIEDGKPETGLLTENTVDAFVSEDTAVLVDDATQVLVDDNATQVLVNDATMPLIRPTTAQSRRSGGKKLNIIEEVMLVHTEEVIECGESTS